MPVSAAVRAYFAERIWRAGGAEGVPRNFLPLPVPATGRSTVEGCASGGKNVLEVSILGRGGRVEDVRVSCGLCNPAMYVAADLLCEWARGRSLEEIAGLDPLAPGSLAPLFERLGGPGRPDDAREKMQYALLALQNAVRAHRGEPPAPLPRVAPASGRDPDEAE